MLRERGGRGASGDSTCRSLAKPKWLCQIYDQIPFGGDPSHTKPKLKVKMGNLIAWMGSFRSASAPLVDLHGTHCSLCHIGSDGSEHNEDPMTHGKIRGADEPGEGGERLRPSGGGSASNIK
jgi:hypothetical protein